MHLVTVAHPLNRGAKLHVGSYLTDDINAGQMLAAEPTKIHAQHFDFPKPLAHLSAGLGTARVLIIRAGAFGDLLFLAAAIRAYKCAYPGAYVAVACFAEYGAIFANNPDVSEIVPYPVPLAIADTFDAIVPLEETVENETEKHAVDLFLEHLQIDPADVPAERKRCVYHPTDFELSDALAGWPRKLAPNGSVIPRLGVQVAASALNRTYPHTHLAQVFAHLHGTLGWEIFVFGSPKTINIAEADRLVNLSARGLDFRHSAAILTTCDIVLAPDSALAHLAGALDLPCVALYGPFPYQLRTRYHPKTFALNGAGACAPCFHRGDPLDRWPADQPCALSGRCEVLASIPPACVANKLVTLYLAAQRIDQQRRGLEWVLPIRKS